MPALGRAVVSCRCLRVLWLILAFHLIFPAVSGVVLSIPSNLLCICAAFGYEPIYVIE